MHLSEFKRLDIKYICFYMATLNEKPGLNELMFIHELLHA